MIFSIPYEPPSMNRTTRAHWSARKRDVDLCANLIRVYAGLTDKATGPRKVHILAYRKRLCSDIDNYRGGCKSLVDAIVRRGLLVDDNDKMASFTYEQRVMSQMPGDLKAKFGGRPCTTITITE